jgi:polar amino acid transport system substrate-binding protein
MLRYVIFIALLLQFLLTSAAGADTLDFIRASKTVAVGVKTDYAPFGFQGKTGAIQGFEPDLAADLARQLGAELQLVPALTSNRIQLLRQGKIDIIIATMTDTAERRELVQVVEPFYYSDFTNILLRKDAGIFKWADLQDKTLCATAGSIQIAIANRYGAKVLASDGVAGPLAALESGACAGYIYNQSYIVVKLRERRWNATFEMPLPSLAETPWVIAVRKGETRLKKAVDEITAGWAKSGLIMELEEKWHIPASAYAASLHDQYRRK